MPASAGPPAGFTYVADDSAVATPGDGVAKAECPAGEKLVGGGGVVASQGLDDGYLHSFRPADGPDGDLSPDDAWLVDAHVDSDDEAAVGATAICGDEAARLERTKVTVPGDGSRSGVARCANGENVSAGGVVIGGSLSQAFLELELSHRWSRSKPQAR